MLDMVKVLRACGEVLHASGNERAVSTNAVALGVLKNGTLEDDSVEATAQFKSVLAVRARVDAAFDAAVAVTSVKTARRLTVAREALETERYRVHRSVTMNPLPSFAPYWRIWGQIPRH